jgi:hypothetical protein
MGRDGVVYEVPAHLWAATDADTLFDNGGCLEVRTGRLAVPSRPTMAEDSAIVLVNRNELQGLTAILDDDSSPTAATTTAEGQQVEMGRTGLPGRPTISHVIEEELQRRATAGECAPTLRAEAKALIAWAAKAYPNAPRVSTKGLENRIRDLYSALVRPTK